VTRHLRRIRWTRGRTRVGSLPLLTQRCGGANDSAIILAQDFEPGANIVGMAHRWYDAKRSTHEGAGDLGDQLLLGIPLRSEATGEITIAAPVQ
jgi:hypothetical protein